MCQFPNTHPDNISIVTDSTDRQATVQELDVWPPRAYYQLCSITSGGEK
jgi:hypothetical protein